MDERSRPILSPVGAGLPGWVHLFLTVLVAATGSLVMLEPECARLGGDQ
jgi:hypothetical protein